MKLSTRSRYGTRLMLDMAQHYGHGPLHLAGIAQRQGISVKYLEQIIIPLKRARLVKGIRGPKGGHILAKPPEAITVGEIVALMENGGCITACSERPEVCRRSETCATRSVWQDAANAMFAALNAVTLADLMNSQAAGAPGPGDLDVTTEE
jgi:Rrf2 family protein